MIRVAINGFGRIGRASLRALYDVPAHRAQFKVVAINDIAPAEAMYHLFKYDSTHGRNPHALAWQHETLTIAGDQIELLHEPELSRLPWADLGIDLVIEASGQFNCVAQLKQHLQQGARKVLVSHPATSDVDATIVYGVNHEDLTGQEQIVSSASCTTHCCVPVLAALDKHFGIAHGGLTTIHSMMNDQNTTDSYQSHLRGMRAASQSIVPVATKLARGIERLLPQLQDRLLTSAVRVPVINVTAMDLTLQLNQNVDIHQVLKVLVDSQQAELAGLLDISYESLVSVDFNHNSHSVTVDATQITMNDSGLLKMLLWCDNEWGYAHRLLDTAAALFSASDKEE
ncbi:MAG: erythrose-4-phosphate dehydrogenase [Shewanellaceae bacterium]|nr:erythrose-4-phosphate dehydrogenase [Shewanellaceae bacterium]